MRRDRRLAALALLFAVLLTGWFFVIVAQDWFADQQSTLSRDQKLLARYRLTIATEDTLRRRLEAVSTQIREDGLFVPGSTLAHAGVQLQERVKTMIRAEDGQVRTVRSRASENSAQAAVSVDVQAKLTPAGLLNVFQVLEGGAPLLLIDRLQLKRDQDLNHLLVSFTVRGFVDEGTS